MDAHKLWYNNWCKYNSPHTAKDVEERAYVRGKWHVTYKNNMYAELLE